MDPPPATPLSPISSLLQTIGMSREDLARHSEQMRKYLTAQDPGAVSAMPFLRGLRESATPEPAASAPSSQRRARSGTRSRTHSLSAIAAEAALVPSTPIKSEPVDAPVPLRSMSSMEMVIERKSKRVRKEKRGKDRRERTNSLTHPPSPSPLPSSLSLDTFMQARASRKPSFSDASKPAKAPLIEPHPVTPTHSRHYRIDTSTTPGMTRQNSLNAPHGLSPYYRPETYVRSSPRVHAFYALTLSQLTPQKPHNMPNQLSSPAYAPGSSPQSSPSRPSAIVNLVSSPGPMAPTSSPFSQPLPYTLPSPPYLQTKPELSYAALIGQAVLSSEQHMLTLQEIYEWITTVYPYYKRNEQTWMNSVRHVLSTTAVFRKAPPRESETGGRGGKTRWAIWDKDIKCFEGGGFDKRFCEDIVKKDANKKRAADEIANSSGGGGSGSGSGARKAKRVKKTLNMAPPLGSLPVVYPQPVMATASLTSHAYAPVTMYPGPSLAPSVHAHPHHQTYVQACNPGHHPPGAMVFPPLPTAYATQGAVVIPSHRTRSASSASATTASQEEAEREIERSPSPETLQYPPSPTSPPSRTHSPSSSPPPTSASSVASSSMLPPDLTTDSGSSSSPTLPSSSVGSNLSSKASVSPMVKAHDVGYEDIDDEESPAFDVARATHTEFDLSYPVPSRKGKERDMSEPTTKRTLSLLSLPPMPESPTMGKSRPAYCQGYPFAPPESPTLALRKVKLNTPARPPGTPPTASIVATDRPRTPDRQRPQTPPPKTVPTPPQTPSQPSLDPARTPPPSTPHKDRDIMRYLNLSPERTPLSHRGVHMSPSPSLAYYKSHLEPPPPMSHFTSHHLAPLLDINAGVGSTSVQSSQESEHQADKDALRTPSLARGSGSGPFVLQSAGFGPPVTPKKLIFPSFSGTTPLRAGKGGVYDPHDPALILDEELRLGGPAGFLGSGLGLQESPTGLFGGTRGMLYESPNLPSPGPWSRRY
ncbi:hypothetical protein PUNSTDRAFT_125734 [Punctularia strigosozonata HHB-11173 SS5]|uniref:uncharacterized protein n=1 Tax=Punctularia strigosozonata (strain HHB-11173) TaxID=741275 RepID=UPI000441775D|nr:uncharacterized protein PUNSTDRAFT_125734 [Punctularia strigosozonata HHB-11173 SS5]EIN09547.1 hypothetical protein PUNSTDRAFT_125734 [Punctularia strigosozonata HHB-11173 SS5]